MRTIKEPVNGNEKRRYIYLADNTTANRFITDAEKEGYTYGEGVKYQSVSRTISMW